MFKRLEKVDRMLAFLEENIDEQHCNQVEKRHINAIKGKTRNDLPLSIFCKSESDLFSTVEVFNDPEKMLYNELMQAGEFGSVINSVKIKDDYPLQIRSNHGIAVSHNLVGGKYVVNEGATPWAIHEESITEYRRTWEDMDYNIHAGVPAKVISTYQYFSERLSEYPVCKRCIRLSHPDMQSPFSIAQSLIGNNFFYDLYDSPDDVHWLLEKITDAYIAFHRAISPLINDTTIDGSIYIMGAIFPGSVLLKEDTSVVCLSGDQIIEFCRTYNDRIAAELGPISYHYCGRSLP